MTAEGEAAATTDEICSEMETSAMAVDHVTTEEEKKGDASQDAVPVEEGDLSRVRVLLIVYSC